MTARIGILVLSSLLSTGCFRTIYRNLQAPDAMPVVETDQTLAHRTKSGWLSYFLWGLVPSGITVDAAVACGGGEHVGTIETRQTALEYTVELFAGYYLLNVYAPYNGHVTCDHATPR